jgi:hypothetical protein
MPKEYIIYCDESETRGRKFSNFYGGALVDSDHIDEVREAIKRKKHDLNLFGEVKWSKITVNYHEKYIALMDFFFDLVGDGKIKLRVMFTQNAMRPSGLTADQVENQYAILYYYFIRHAFGLRYSPSQPSGARIRIYPDRMPISDFQVRQFKSFVVRLTNRTEFRERGLRFALEDITEVVSHHHDVLQCLDIVLGAMNFRLNEKHLDKPEGASRRSPKTRAKEKVFDRISQRIRAGYPHFNIGITTGHQGDYANRWHHAYRHWNFQTRKAWR